MNISIINPLEYPNWDNLLLAGDRATFFHTSAWTRVLVESYGYKPLYFTAMDRDRLVGLIAVMEIDSFLTGRRGVSLPFTDMCPPIADTPDTFQALMGQVTEYGNRAGWKYMVLKGGDELLDDAPSCAEHFTHILELSGDEDSLKKKFRDSTRRNIRKSVKRGVEVSFQATREAIAAFFRLHCRTRQRHGLPPQPWSFFEKIHEHIIAPHNGLVALAVHRGKPVAGAVLFLFRDLALYKFGASDKKFQHLRANNLLFWEAIRWCHNNGFQTLHLGRTEPGNPGLLQFKRGWRATEGRLKYFRFNFKRNVFAWDTDGLKSSYHLFKILPLPVLRLTGKIFFKHIG